MKTLALASLLGFALVAPVHASPMSIDLTTGTAGGDALALSATSLFMTTAFDADDDEGVDFNFSGMQPLLAGGDLEAVAGHPAGEYDISRFIGGTSAATEGSVYVLKGISVNAGDMLSFDWIFYTNELALRPLADAAYFSVLNDFTVLIASATDADLDTDTAGLSGYRVAKAGLFTHTFTTGGIFDFVFAVVDTDDFAYSSAFAINDLTLTAAAPAAVSEPGTIALMLAGMGLVGMAARRRRA